VKAADKIVMRPIGALSPYASNSRTHTPEQITKIARSIEVFGFTNPILVDGDKGIIAGHARLKAAQQLGLTEVPTIELRWLSPVERQAYVIADNELAITGSGWDQEMLRLELGDLKELGFDLALTGFDDVELGAIFADKTAGLTDPDDAPAVPEHPVSQTGDLWILGRHRLLCGDSTVATDVERVLGGVEPHLMVTDPPYGVNYSAGWRNVSMPAKNDPSRWRDGHGRATGAVMNDDRSDWREAWALFPGDVTYVWHPPGAKQVEFFNSLAAVGFEIRMQIIWAKSHFPIGRGNYHVQHEPCWYAVRKGKTAHWNGDRTQSTLWQIPKPSKSETGHSTQKPVDCMQRPIENNSSPGQAVYDPFIGSGTTMIAAEQTGRSCLCLEISPAYVDVTVKRWQDFTGKQAALDGDGRTFDDITATRRTIVDSALAPQATAVAGSP
jgi:DNA modification methylase